MTIGTDLVILTGNALALRRRRKPRRNLIRARVRWIERSMREWPDTLRVPGWRYRLSLMALEQRDIDKSQSFMAAIRRDVITFETAYQFHEWIGRHRLALPKPA